ncbi:GGDEF domain-containing protein [Enterobacter cancerogenus]|uniref:GGDEF domain-containing protein n=1 Tax=Enterobacter cancerogenus TaxID=69218 RepID=UPI0037F36F38
MNINNKFERKIFLEALLSNPLHFLLMVITFFAIITSMVLTRDYIAIRNSISNVSNYLDDRFIILSQMDEAVIAELSSLRKEFNGVKVPIPNELLLLREHQELSNEDSRLLFSLEKIKQFSDNNIINNMYSFDEGYNFVYFFNRDEYKEIDVRKLVKPYTSTFESVLNKKDMLNKILSWKVSERQGNVTDVYIDHAGHGPTISYFYPVFDFHKDKFAGYIVADNPISNLTQVIQSTLTHGKTWFSLTLLSRNNQQTCFYGDCINDKREIKVKLSDAFSIEIGFSTIEYMRKSRDFVLAIYLSTILALCSLFIKAIIATKGRISNMKDSLSGLGNRDVLKYIDCNPDSSVIIFDCNKFKEINDSYGHHVGDMAIVKISDTIKRNIRAEDLAIRYGGDEFMVYLPSNGRQAVVIADRILSELSFNPIYWEGKVVSLSLSYGWTMIDGTLDIAIKNADNNMYKSKFINSKNAHLI